MGEAKTFAACSLQEFTHSLILAQSWGRERVFIDEFFADQPFIITEEYVTIYQHHLYQYVWEKFFKDQNFKKIIETTFSPVGIAPIFEDIQCDLDKSFRAYKNAAVGYTATDGQKILASVQKHHGDEIVYKIYSSVERAGLLGDWAKLAREKNFYRGKKITAGCRFLDLKQLTWDDVILPAGTKKLLVSMVGRSDKADIYRANGLSLKRGVLMKGNPGTGKTTVLKIVAKATDCSVVYALPSHLTYPSDVKNVCQMARDLAPTKLLIEDLDHLAEDRESGNAGRVIELMNQLSGIEDFDDVETWGTTNCPEKIEAAVKNRPGRFDRVIDLPNPEDEERRQMVLLFTKKWILEDVDIDKIVKQTNKLTGAHMNDLCQTAAGNAIEEESYGADKIAIVKGKHFRAALKEVKNKDYSAYLKAVDGGGKMRGFADLEEMLGGD
jgi:hypothetical protein